MATTMTPTHELDDAVAKRVERLNTASVRRVIEPEEAFAWGELGKGQLIPDVLLTIDPDEYGLTPEQRATLSREEVASLLESGVRFESVLISAFAMELAESRHLVDARSTYALHEMGEETRHSRAFLRLVEHIEPTAPRLLLHGAADVRAQAHPAGPAAPCRPALRLRAGRRGDPRPDAEAGHRAPRAPIRCWPR